MQSIFRHPFLLVVLMVYSSINAQDKKSMPTFDRYPLLTVHIGKTAPIQITGNPKAAAFKEELGEIKDSKPNFAGHYILVRHKTSAASFRIALVDAFTGTVYTPLGFHALRWNPKNKKESGLSYRLHSNLLVAFGIPDDLQKEGRYYYLWENNDFTLIDREMPPDSVHE